MVYHLFIGRKNCYLFGRIFLVSLRKPSVYALEGWAARIIDQKLMISIHSIKTTYMISSHTLIDRVHRGELNFKRFVELLSTRGYITEENQEEGCGFVSSAMEAAHQDDFDALFAQLLPGVLNNISLSCVATDEGGPSGAFAYALCNTNVIDREEVLCVLVEENRGTTRWLESNTEH